MPFETPFGSAPKLKSYLVSENTSFSQMHLDYQLSTVPLEQRIDP